MRTAKLRHFIKSIIPSNMTRYIQYKKAEHRTLSLMREHMHSTAATGFSGLFVLDYKAAFSTRERVIDGEEYYSQLYQDYFLDKFIFFRKTGGLFLDIGGNDPVAINNTYFFEKNRDWSGLAFEPIAAQRAKWKDSRKTECLPAALGSTTGEAEFCEYDAHYMSGFTNDVDCSGKVKTRYKVPVMRLADVLSERGIKHVDFVSLDVEGAELEVLQGIDFSSVEIDCFCIENNKGKRKEKPVRQFMTEHGYKMKAWLWIDEVWVKG
ncbi:MAG: FkbM family methyltransferase [Synergistaceae bacterium]|nr:FkbM family methyltransferase [Synergistaceae bacterium]